MAWIGMAWICLTSLPRQASAQQSLSSGDLPASSPLSSASGNSLGRMLGAGEYGLAIQAARQSSNAGQQLQQIAEHQRRHGAGQAALSTLAEARQYLAAGSSSGGSEGSARPRPSGRRSGGALGGAGGQVQADFTSLVNLIQTTVDPLSWEDNGGFGVITPYPNGVLIDASGKLEFDDRRRRKTGFLETPANPLALVNETDRTMISLPRLEQEVMRLVEAGQPIPPSIQYLDGLYDLEFVWVDPQNHDLVLVGPAGPWEENDQGIAVNRKTGRAVMTLDDLVVALRSVVHGRGVMGCSIDPRPGQFEQIAQYLAKHSVTNDRQRQALRTAVGPQDAVVFGVPRTSHAAHVLLTADYHLKLLAMGHVDGGRDLPSYLDLCGPDDPTSEVIRWWFTLGSVEIEHDPAQRYFRFDGTALELKTERQLINRQRAADPSLPAQQFVGKFNQHFASLQKRFPLYGQLENVFELAIAAQTIHSYQLMEKSDWPGEFLVGVAGHDRYQLKSYRPIEEVELVVNHRRQNIRRPNGKLATQTITAVSGGVDTGTSRRRILQASKEISLQQLPAGIRRVGESDETVVHQPTDHFRWARN